jgi:tRNA A37 N6-isopentenylltransferase MiaA
MAPSKPSQREQDLERILADIKETCREAKREALASRPDDEFDKGMRWGAMQTTTWLLRRIHALEDRPESERYREAMATLDEEMRGIFSTQGPQSAPGAEGEGL